MHRRCMCDGACPSRTPSRGELFVGVDGDSGLTIVSTKGMPARHGMGGEDGEQGSATGASGSRIKASGRAGWWCCLACCLTFFNLYIVLADSFVPWLNAAVEVAMSSLARFWVRVRKHCTQMMM